MKYVYISDSLGPSCKILVTGSVPTENLSIKSYDTERKERRALVRSDLPIKRKEPPTKVSITSLLKELDKAKALNDSWVRNVIRSGENGRRVAT